MKVMLVDDEESIQTLVRILLESSGYEYYGVREGSCAVEAAKRESPDLILLDVVLPGSEDGFAVCRKLRAAGITVPVIFLSIRGEIVDKIAGFSAGGDDYFAKPFDPRELLLHIQAFLRREQHAARTADNRNRLLPLKSGRFEFDQRRFTVRKDGESIPLTPKEFNILFTLVCNAGEVVSQKELVEASWGDEYLEEMTSLAVYIRRIRRKIEDDPPNPVHLLTSWGSGYMWKP